jgi:hypothetical protein
MRVDGIIHFTSMQGWGVAGNIKAHPAIGNTSDKVTIGCPLTKTLVFAVIDETLPPCGHIIEAPACRRKTDI